MNKKLVVITGASSVFGKEMAKLFNQQGYPMLLLARRTEKIKELNLDFRNVIIEKVDVTNYSAIQKAILCAEKLYGKTDLLVNNAGVMLLGDISTQIPMEWEKMLETNVLGVLNGMKIVLEDMKKEIQERLLIFLLSLDIRLLKIMQRMLLLNLVFMD